MLPAFLPGHPLQKHTDVQWDIDAALGADHGADESTSPQAGISQRHRWDTALALSFGQLPGNGDLAAWRLTRHSAHLRGSSSRLPGLAGTFRLTRLLQQPLFWGVWLI